ncbi:MFS efflux transporter [Penicillium verhagenii]|uniref:MFS efflux transporter n=1 Tax=Penicillium verhagenii TaxID=1562060 RepID=UPI002544D7EA|nr:MFS efflux transporter [Penicillium verhagenii]KAJ5921143.1 MFS efflux transporter [Penicillium verhagenii]
MAARPSAIIEGGITPQIANLVAVVRKDHQGVASRPTYPELDEFQSGSSSPTRGYPSSSPRAVKTLLNSTDVESLSASLGLPRDHERAQDPAGLVTADVAPSLSNPPRNKWRFLSACMMFLANGLGDSAPGALIPYMEEDYHIGYSTVSLIFVANAVGFILAAPLTHAVSSRLGRSKTSMICQALLLTAFTLIVCKVPFPVVVVSSLLIGLGTSINISLNNVFLANMVNGTEVLGVAHGSYGIGGTIAPLIATAMVSHGIQWTYFYFISLTLAVFNLLYSGWALKGFEKELPGQLVPCVRGTAFVQDEAQQPAQKSVLRKAVKSKVTLLGALFIFAYQGAEVSISGWIVSYLISYRDGDPAHVGYVSSGFWAGITIGRFALSHPAHRVGEKLSVFVLTLCAIIFQLLAWFIPNTIGQAVAVAIIGLILGPVYPCGAVVFSKLLPRNIQTASLSFITAMGSSGGAFAPFITGLLAQHLGTVVLHPICLVLYAMMLVSWCCLPRIAKRSD